MARSITIESANRSVRWYLTPGEQTTYDIAVTNPCDVPIHCVLQLEEPPSSGAIQPSAFSLDPGESRNVELTFRADAKASRDQLAIVTARDSENHKIGEFQITLISAGGTDCATSLAWKASTDSGATTGKNSARNFVLALSVKSLSQSDGDFIVEFSEHPSLKIPKLEALHLSPGQSANVDVPIRWRPGVTDAEGLNHPRNIEVGVAVSQGRRSSRVPWDLIERKLAGISDEEIAAPAVLKAEAAKADPVTPAPAPRAPAPPSISVLPAASAVVVQPADGLEESVVGLPRRGFRPFDLPEEPSQPPPERKTADVLVAPAPLRESGPRIPTLINIGIAAVILAVAVVFFLPRPNQSGVATTAAVVTSQPTIAAMVAATNAPKKRAHAKGPKAGAPQTKATTSASATAVATAAAQPVATPHRIALSSAQIAAALEAKRATPKPKPSPTPRRQRRAVDRSSTVAMAGISARYGPAGRNVRVLWAASAQASANIQLIDDRGTVISSAGISGPRQNALLYVPRSYHGPIYVQVVSMGYSGERVTQSTSLPPF
ncbi:MAG TPA: hypothetical protein VN934_05165 [Candidatus Tumulicola sp.]|nr:hypothetical protein [Candidatus Tumulicola sp.]